MKHKLWRLVKGLIQICICIVCIMFIIYTLAWVAFTKRAEAYISAAISHHPSLEITGNTPQFKGYPYPPEAHFSGTIKHPSGLVLDIPDLYYFGFPVLHQLQYIEFKNGLSLTAPFLDRDLNLDYAAIQIILPYHFPVNAKQENIIAWQKSNDPIYIPNLAITAGKISATGSGTISLDENLQIKADINAHITGMDTLLDELEETHGKKNVAIARGFLNMMTQIDPETGKQYFETTLKIQNRAIYFGPMRLSGLPEIKWGEDGMVSGKENKKESWRRQQVAPEQQPSVLTEQPDLNKPAY